MTAAIGVSNLGKRYSISQSSPRGGYRTLRESLVDLTKGTFSRRKRGEKGTSDFWALKGVDFQVQPGEVVGIIGRNGAGKSTLLKILSRITKPTEGRIEIQGRIGSLLEVGTGFHPELTGRENVYLNGSILGMSRREIAGRFEEIVAFAEVERFLDTPVKRYSSGMYVRLAFAVAAHLDPEILIIDEVLAVGDIEFQKKCLNKMNAVGKSGRTILFVSHNHAAVENLCSRAIHIDMGRVTHVGSVAEVIGEYHRASRVAGTSSVDLARHPNRRGGPIPRFQALRISSSGEPTTAVRMGSPLEILVSYDCGEKPADLKIGLNINDYRGVKIVNLTPEWQAPALMRNSPARATMRCVVPQLFLADGCFTINLYYDDGTNTESIEGACELEVLPADVFETGRPPESKHGVVYMPYTWERE